MHNDSTVFVVGGESAFRDSVVALVERKGLRAEAFASPDDFLAEYNPGRKGCVVIGHRAGGDTTALNFLHALKGRKAIMPVIVADGDAGVPMVVQAIQAGAVNFLEKPTEAELSEAIDRALVTEQEQHTKRKEIADMRARLETLTDDELEVFRRLLAGHANKRIAADLDIGLRTVELRRANITRKMQAESLPDLVRMAILLDILQL